MTKTEDMKPVDVTGADTVFGRISGLMPPLATLNAYKGGWGEKLFSNWFYRGLAKMDLQPKPGIDKGKAISHIRSIMVSFEPKHEHKEAACGYLFELWFEPTSTWEPK